MAAPRRLVHRFGLEPRSSTAGGETGCSGGVRRPLVKLMLVVARTRDALVADPRPYH